MESGVFRVLYIQGVTVMGGAHRSLLALLSRLDRRRFSPLVVTSGEGYFTEELQAAGVEVRLLPMGMWRKGKSWPRIPWTLWRIWQVIRKERVALVHGNTLWDNPYAVIPAGWAGVPVICHVRSVPRPDMVRKYYLNRTARVVAISDYIQQCLEPALGERVVRVYNGIEVEGLDLGRARRKVRRELGVGEEMVVVGMTSRLDPLKGQEVFIRAAASIKHRCPKARLLVVAEAMERISGYGERLRRLAHSLGVAERFVFWPYRRDILEITAALDVAVLPSLNEGFGRTNLEAMAAGKPVVSTLCGGIPEVVVDGQTGLLVPPQDVEALAQALLELVEDEGLRRRLGEAGRRRAKEMFSLEQHAACIQNLYAELLERV